MKSQRKRLGCLACAVIWLCLGVVNYGFFRAEMDAFFLRMDSGSQKKYWCGRDGMGICVAESSTGPLGLVVALVVSDFGKDGWHLQSTLPRCEDIGR